MSGHGLLFGGSLIVDLVKRINVYPSRGKLAVIREVTRGVGGMACNNPVNVKVLDKSTRVATMGRVGDDDLGRYIKETLSEYGVDISGVVTAKGSQTSFTDVMADASDGSRTFFHSYGACAEWCPDDIPWDEIEGRYTYAQLGYALLLSAMDAPDTRYGVVLAGVLKKLKDIGIRTAIDVVSEEGDRFRSIVGPCLPFVDDLIINEVEAGGITGDEVRGDDGKINPDAMLAAARKLIESGVQKTVVLHAPEGAIGVTKSGEEFIQPSHHIKPEEIIGSVGAGDAFASGVVYGLSKEWDIKDAMRLGTAMAAMNLFNPTTTGGARPLGEVKKFMSQRPYREGVF